MKAKKIISVFVLLVVTGVLYAQNSLSLKSGVYKFSGIQGAGNIVIKATNYSATKQIIVHAIDGTVMLRGTVKINGNRMNVDYGNNGFETFTIIDEISFVDNNGFTWFWVRLYKSEDL